MTLAFVTGGSRGLGLATAKGLRASGCDVVLFATDRIKLEIAASEIGGKFKIVDFLDLDHSQTVLKGAIEEFGIPDILILAHGVMSEKMSKTLRTNIEEWKRVLSINLDSVFLCLNVLAPGMVERRSGRIIVYSACLGRMSGPGNAGGLAPYRISKAGVNALVRNFAHETGLGSRGFLVDAVCPNHTRTDMGGANAPRSVEEGAETAIWLASREFDPSTNQTGVLWEDRKVIPW
ncbi:MAG: SDR family NAD(P)-dependent oxidoreductase [Actinobacteria bacterium]|nr:SDR family NAD(P)-dependent oxidoreductase [Actinomycetota bacterium]